MNFGFSNIGIAKFRYSKHWNLFETLGLRILALPNFWLVQTLEIGTSAIPNIRILFFWLFQTLKIWILALRNLNFGFSKHWNSEFWIFTFLNNFLSYKTFSIGAWYQFGPKQLLQKRRLHSLRCYKVCNVCPFYFLTGRFLLSSWIANLDPVRLFANQKTPKLRD